MWAGALSMERWLKRRGVERALVHMLVWTVSLTGFISKSGRTLCKCGLTHAALLSSYYRFPWNLFKAPLMLTDHFFAQHSLFLPSLQWKIEQQPKKRKRGGPFTVLSHKHRPMQTPIRGKSHPGSPLSSALI